MPVKKSIVLGIFAGCLLCGCAQKPPMFSDDRGMITFKRSGFSYRKPGKPETSCKYDETRQQAICDDGTASKLVVAGLPFEGVVLVEFDGRQFRRAPNK